MRGLADVLEEKGALPHALLLHSRRVPGEQKAAQALPDLQESLAVAPHAVRLLPPSASRLFSVNAVPANWK